MVLRAPVSIRLNLMRCFSSAANNITSFMGLDSGGDCSSQTALIIDDGISLTYGDLAVRIGKFVSILHSKYSINRGDRVLARVTKSIDALALYLATLRLGGVYVPLNPAYTSSETSHFVKDAKPRVFVTNDMDNDVRFADIVPHVIEFSTISDAASKYSPDYGVECVDASDAASICYTSGTTGLPKGAVLSHGALRWNSESVIDRWRFTRNDIMLHQLPFYHVHGMFIALNCSLLTRSAVIWRPTFNVNDTLKWLPISTVMMGVPTYYIRLLQEKRFKHDLVRHMRLFVSGSAPLSAEILRNFESHTGFKILERYGMTETLAITSNDIEQADQCYGSVGKILDGGKMRLSKSNVIEVCMPSLFSGYWKNPEKTRESCTEDGYFITGDIGRIDENGYLWILGRSKDLIISGGLNVHSKEVEDAIDSCPEIAESAVIGVPHSDLGEAVVAVCVRQSKSPTTSQQSIKNYLRHFLANYKIPKRIVFVDTIPKNAMAKVLKNVLRNEYRHIFLND